MISASSVVPADSADRSVDVYLRSVSRSFSFLKQTTALDDLFTKSVPLDSGGYLLPICELHATDEALIKTLASWREKHRLAFPTQFPVTVAGTRAWLRQRLLDVEDRLLFLVTDEHGYPVGHLGLANARNDRFEVEIDNVVRGVDDAQPGIMSGAMRALLEWTEQNVAPSEIALRVLRDNVHAISFYRKLGFVDDGLVPLRRFENGTTISYEPLDEHDRAEPDSYFLRMVYRPTSTVDGAEIILTAGPSISAREISYVTDAVRHGWNHQWSGYLKRFEAEFADYLEVKHATATSSCTGALHLALAALGIGPGDEVIVPDLTWVATANAVAYVGATPVFVDVERDSWCMDPDSLEAAITARTRVVIPVHLYGHPAPMGRIMDIARRHNLRVIEDAAPAIGATIDGRKVGTYGDIAAFSFQGAKLMVTGEGGMLVTNNDELYARLASVADQGRDPDRQFWINSTGLKYKMANVQAAIGLGQIERVDEMIEAKRRIFAWYADALRDVPSITLNYESRGVRSIYWMTSILLDQDAGITRDQLRAALKARNVDTRPVFPAISQYPIWVNQPQIQPVARLIGDQGINLPSGVRLHREQVEYISRCVAEILAAAR
jgi:perosamine synthetase